jgi:hypothetical protein
MHPAARLMLAAGRQHPYGKDIHHMLHMPHVGHMSLTCPPCCAADALESNEEETAQLVEALLEHSCLELLVQRLGQLKEANDDEAAAAHSVLAIFENMVEVKPEVRGWLAAGLRGCYAWQLLLLCCGSKHRPHAVDTRRQAHAVCQSQGGSAGRACCVCAATGGLAPCGCLLPVSLVCCHFL